jgi:hypothetical protein
MLKSFFRKSTASQAGPAPQEAASLSSGVTFEADGVHYAAPGVPAAEWLANPYQAGQQAELGARLSQLSLEGLGECRSSEFFLDWNDLYAVLRSPDFGAHREALQIPAETSARPRIASRGALVDPDFTLLVDGWVDPQGRSLVPAPRLKGRVLESGDTTGLLPDQVHFLLVQLERFHATPVSERTQAFKEQIFGHIRKHATASHCPLSDYVARTIVLTPERLRLTLDRRGVGEEHVLEVVPGFDEAPAQWLSQFDRLPLQASYDVPDGPALVRVIVTPEVKAVLAEIKRMPGRRAYGPRAEAFVRNPFAVLGEASEKVIDPEQFDQAREAAGIRFVQFSPRVERGEFGEVNRVGLEIDSLNEGPAESRTVWFADPGELSKFTAKLDRCLDDGSQCVRWAGEELEILGETPDHLIQMQAWLREWSHPRLWTADEVLDLSHYSERIQEIGVEKPCITPVIARNDDSKSWFGDDVSPGIRIDNGEGVPPTFIPLTFDEVPTLQQAVRVAEQERRTHVQLPGLPAPVPVEDAKAALNALALVRQELKDKTFDPEGGKGKGQGSPTAKRLVIKSNFEAIDYTETRAGALTMPDGARPVMPASLRPEVSLKPHQEVGVAWLQHLWSMSPQQCRGTVLADDMGLGKTLQLLTFMTACFEQEPDLPPALVVAPVALLENWRNELGRFFAPGTLPLLMLYGDTLKSLRVGKHELDAELKTQGITRLLKKGWVGDAKLVLTTYETMRDLEFALASQPWSVMICDEAQKIKTPAAMVTRSAKKQKVRFRIACTGTPVENTLADLWCLFDFVQPGMLGALSQFSRTYRQPIEAKTDEQRAKVEELRTLIKPQILHRKKTEVAKDLPTPAEDDACKRLPMSPYQLGLYESALKTLKAQRETNPSAQLQTLLAIRQICSDPHGYAEKNSLALPIDRLVNESPKMGWLMSLLKELAADQAGQHKVIVFCEFRELQLQLQRVIAAFFGIAASIVNGDTSADPLALFNRQQLIDEFQAKAGFNVIILSPLAVGFGVNIQAANHVVHFTRTWNPAKEDQATARAYRIGQTRTVQVYYPGVVSDRFPSFDVRLDSLLSQKRELASDMLNGCSDIKAADFADFA